MKRWKKIVLSGLASILIAVAIFAIPTIWGKPWSINHFYGRVFLSFMLEHPQMLSTMRILEPLGFDAHNARLDDLSIDGTRREIQMVADSVAMLHRYDRSEIDDKLSYDVLDWYLSSAAEGERWAFHNYPVNQLRGWQSGLPDFMIKGHQINDKNDAENYLVRLSLFGVAFDQMIESVSYREQLGIVPPRFVISKVLKEIREFVAPAAEEHVLYSHLQETLSELPEVSEEDRVELLAEASRLLGDVVYPAYTRLIDHYAELEPEASTDDGVWKLPDGDEFYVYTLKKHTTTTLDPEEVHTIGLAEVERIQSEMVEILQAEGYASEDFGATMQALMREPRFLYPDTDDGHQQILDDYQAIVDEIDSNLDDLFFTKPAAKVVVERVPEFKQATAPGAYYGMAPLDQSRPATFNVNLRDSAEIPRFGMRTLAYHEAIPGHHFQIATAQEMEGVPFFRRVIPFTAYAEGWALYAEQIAAEHGFQDDPYDRLGYLTAQLFRAARLVVDTGIHHQRWTREQAIEYMVASSGLPESEVVAEIERYIVDPGQACAYMIGLLEFLKLREEAREALGDAFDIRQFHQILLGNGSLPLSLLRREVEKWYKGLGKSVR